MTDQHSDLNSNTRLYVAHICNVYVNWMKTVGDAFKMSIYSYIQDQIFRNGDGRQRAKKHHITMQSSTQILDPF